MTITISKTHLIGFLTLCAFVFVIWVSFNCGIDTGKRASLRAHRAEVRELNERIKELEDEINGKKFQTIDSYASYRMSSK